MIVERHENSDGINEDDSDNNEWKADEWLEYCVIK